MCRNVTFKLELLEKIFGTNCASKNQTKTKAKKRKEKRNRNIQNYASETAEKNIKMSMHMCLGTKTNKLKCTTEDTRIGGSR